MTAPDRGISEFIIGDFVGDNRADVFFADGQTWWVSDGGTAPFVPYASSSFKRRDLAFGKFDGSGKTEVAGVVANQWMFVPANGPHQWTPLRSKLYNTMNGLIVADFDGDGISDIAMPTIDKSDPSQPKTVWGVSLGGRDDSSRSRTASASQRDCARPLRRSRGLDALVWQGNSWDLTSYYVASPQKGRATGHQ